MLFKNFTPKLHFRNRFVISLICCLALFVSGFTFAYASEDESEPEMSEQESGEAPKGENQPEVTIPSEDENHPEGNQPSGGENHPDENEPTGDENEPDGNEPEVTDPSGDITEKSLYDKLSEMSIPLVTITCEDNEEPTCVEVDPPAGCWGAGIADATKVPSRVVVSLKNEIIYDSGDYIKKESGATVKIRGNTSARKAKKAYKVKLQKKGDLLGRGDKNFNDKNWVLLRTGSALNTRVGFWVSELIEQDWTPAHRPVNVWMNGTYRGLYILAESVESNDKCRIKINEDEGYIIEADPYWWNEDVYFPSNLISSAMKYTFKFPDSDDITDEQLETIHNDIRRCEDALREGNYTDYFDSESFAKWILAWDMLGNTDDAGGNMFIVKENNDAKLKMGPVWDFDHAYKVVDAWSAAHNAKIFYYYRLFNADDPTFHNAYVSLWHKYKDIVFPAVLDRIETLRNSEEGKDFDESLKLEAENGIVLEDKSYLASMQGDLEYMCNYFNNWFTERKPWMELNIGNLKDFPSTIGEISEIDGEDMPYYDIMGRRVEPTTKGVLLHAGKKILVK